ncbi:MAG TPA: HTH domain-containing protein [Paludibacter sp.]
MNFIKNINRVEKLHSLILKEKTGTPKELAESLGISRATLYVLIDELNSLNMQVNYSRKHETFYYEQEVKLTLSFKVETIDNPTELRKINGGNFTFSLPSDFSDGRNANIKLKI